MGFYPVALDLSGKLCLVVGGGVVAERKVGSLLLCDAVVRLVSPDLTPGLADLSARGRLIVRQGAYQTSDLDGVFLVVCATGDPATNRLLAADCTDRNLLLNVVDQPELCGFIVPAVLKRGDLTIAVSTGGKSPLLARKLREKLERDFGEQYGEYLELIAQLRQKVLRESRDPEKKLEFLEYMVSEDVLALLSDNRLDLIKERLEGAHL